MEKFTISLPYPQVLENCQENLNELMEIYAGEHSVFTLCNCYFYGKQISLGKLRKAFEQIYKCKYKHLSLLAETILASNGLPLFGASVFWSGKFVNYSTQTKFIKEIIFKEELLINKQNDLLNKTNRQSLKNLLERMLMDSQIHITVLKSFL